MKIWRATLLLLICILSLSLGAQEKQAEIINTECFQNIELLWDLEALSVSPEFTWVDSTSPVRSLAYESVPFEGNPSQVFAYYSNPDLLMGRNTGQVFPGVILVHGGGGKAFKAWVEKWAADGYAALAMNLGGLDGLGEPMKMAGPGQSHDFKFSAIKNGDLKNVWTYHAVASVILAHSLLLEFPEVNSAKTCVTGISWGGYLTCMVAGLDNRFKAAVPVYGCAYYNESDVFKESLSELGSFYETQWMKYFDPSVYLPFAKASLFFVNGNKDRFYNVVPYSKTYGLSVETDKNICIKPDMKHSHTYGWQPVEIKYFFDSILNDGVPLPKVGNINCNNSVIYSEFNSIVGLRSAEFYYSSDTNSANKDRKWESVKAVVDSDKNIIHCDVPKEGFNYAFFYVTDYREVSVSSPFLIK